MTGTTRLTEIPAVPSTSVTMCAILPTIPTASHGSDMRATRGLRRVAVDHPRRRRPRSVRNLILFLAVNADGTSQLALDQECAAIESELRMTPHHEDFEFCSKWSVSVDEMARHLMQLQPSIIHFSGHGACNNLVRGRFSSRVGSFDIPTSADGGICLKHERGGTQIVTARALTMMIRSSVASARLVVLNSSYSDSQAGELCTAVDCVIGMAGAIRDDDACSFAVGFYRALGNRRSVGNALEHAVATLAAKQLANEHLPRLRTRDGVDASQVVLSACA